MNQREFLASVPAFKELSLDERGWLAAHVVARHFEPGEAIVCQNDPASECFVLVSGSASVASGAKGGVANLAPGDLFGEIAIVNGATRSATVTASEPSECLVLPARAIQDLLERNSAFCLGLLRLAVRRLARLEQALHQ